MAGAFLWVVGSMSGNIVVGGTMILLLFVFTWLGLRTFAWWAVAMIASLAVLVAYERWRQ
jgi:hypothetical protein